MRTAAVRSPAGEVLSIDFEELFRDHYALIYRLESQLVVEIR